MAVESTIALAFAAVASAGAAWAALATHRATKKLSEQVAMQMSQYFEDSLFGMYDELRTSLGHPKDLYRIDVNVRRSVYRVLIVWAQTFSAWRNGAVPDSRWLPINAECRYWLQTHEGTRAWRGAFASQEETWPPGFVDHVEQELTTQAAVR